MPAYYLTITSENSSNLLEVLAALFILTIFPLFSFSMIIAFMINKQLRRSIIDPMINLANNPDVCKLNQKTTAKEVVDVHKKILHFINIRDAELRKKETLKTTASLVKIATQVAHDIRSPLTALNMIAKNTNDLQEDMRNILRNATQRINDIAKNLLILYKNPTSKICEESTNKLTIEHAASLLDLSISEKRLQFMKRKIKFNLLVVDHDSFIRVNQASFKRVISNLINNAVEAISDHGEISIILEKKDEQIHLQITDTGCGISEFKIKEVFLEGVSFGKKCGLGIGLPSAINYITTWGGDLSIKSQENKGTIVKILLPQAIHPDWFCKQLVINTEDTVVILDDDQSIHDIWRERLIEKMNLSTLLISTKTPSEFKDILKTHLNTRFLFLIDYELIGYDQSGLDMIEQLNIGKYSKLVTSRYEDQQIRARCLNLGITIIPKNYALHIPIKVISCISLDLI